MKTRTVISYINSDTTSSLYRKNKEFIDLFQCRKEIFTDLEVDGNGKKTKLDRSLEFFVRFFGMFKF